MLMQIYLGCINFADEIYFQQNLVKTALYRTVFDSSGKQSDTYISNLLLTS